MAVNLSPVGGVAAQFFDNSGQVLTGGKLYTYLAGTTTPAATYTTNSGLTANSNPIVLNAAGRVADSGEIWLTDGINYKFVLQDQNSVQIAVWDNISGINSNFVNYTLQEQTFTATQGQTVFTLTGGIQYTPATNNLSVFVNGSKQVAGTNYLETSSTVFTFLTGLNVGDVVDAITAIPVATNVISSNNVSYNQGGTGSTTTNVQAKLQQTVSVKDFGAVGDGITDDTAAIQAAHSASVASGVFPSIYFPAGIYKITTLTWSPYVSAQAGGAVRLETNIASGEAIKISTQYGIPPVYIYNSKRTCVFNGQFVLENNYGSSTTAIGLALGDSNFTSPTYECATSYFNGLTVNYFYTPIKIYNNCHDIGFNNCIFSGNYGPQFDMTDGSSALVNAGANMAFYNCFFAGSISTSYANQYLLSLNTANTCDIHFTNCGWAYLYGGLNNPNVTFAAQGVTVSMTDCHHEWSNTNPNTFLVIKNKATFDIKGGQSGHVGANTPATPFWSNVYTGGHLNVINFQYVLGATTPALLHNVQSGGYGTFDYVPNYYQSVGAPSVPFLAQAGGVGFNGVTRRENITYTPTWTATGTAPVIGNGSIAGNYTINGNQITLNINFIAGSTTTFGTGAWSFSIPIQAGAYTYLGDAVLNGTSNFYLGTPIIIPSANTLTIAVDASPSNGISATVPFTWVNSNTFQLQITYVRV